MSTTEAVPSIKAILVDNLQTSPILVVKCTEKFYLSDKNLAGEIYTANIHIYRPSKEHELRTTTI